MAEESAEQVEISIISAVSAIKLAPISEKASAIPKMDDERRANAVGLTRYALEESGAATSSRPPSRPLLVALIAPSRGQEGLGQVGI